MTLFQRCGALCLTAAWPGPGQAVILDWFKGSVDAVLLAQARAAAGNWVRLPVEELRTLRALKNRIGVLELLQQAGALPDDAGVCDWLALRKHLP